MTATTATAAGSATTHPLDRLTGEEIELNRAIIVDAGHVTEQTLFALVSLVEPDKQDVISGATDLDRRVRSLLIERGSGEQTEICSFP
jgi:primary-amine oxidase